ncbi:30S ribosomal protein S9 [Candidatus Woesearchaeota archaeon]|nr:30S ribosomal protein S9 [Candidatus Woesearchaeota archaeon]
MKPIQISGKRKSAIARAILKEGEGTVRINNQLLAHFSNKLARERINEPLKIAGMETVQKVNLDIDVIGGGWQAQTEAVRLAIARALIIYTKSDKLKKDFLNYDRHLLIADTRRNEACKPNDSGKPRKKRQKSYR